MAVFLSARLMARYSDAYDPDLAAAFQKLADGLPDILAAHVLRTFDLLSRRATDDASERAIGQRLTKAWAERRIVEITYRGGTYDPSKGSRTTRVRPYLIEPSIATRALYLIGWDETREAVRTFKLERIEAVAPDRRHVRAATRGNDRGDVRGGLGPHRRPAGRRGRPALLAGRGRPGPGDALAPERGGRRRRRRIADLAGEGVGDARDPELDPRLGRRRRGPRTRPSCGPRSPGSCTPRPTGTRADDGWRLGQVLYLSHAECPCTRPARSRRGRGCPRADRHLRQSPGADPCVDRVDHGDLAEAVDQPRPARPWSSPAAQRHAARGPRRGSGDRGWPRRAR